MCLDKATRNAAVLKCSPKAHKEAGFLLPAALFLLVVMGLFSSSLVTLSTQAGMATVQEGISIAALNAADSGAQYVLSKLYYPEPASRSDIDLRCANISAASPINFTVAGLKTCSATISCVKNGTTVSYYNITSVGNCGTGQAQAQRTIQVAGKY